MKPPSGRPGSRSHAIAAVFILSMLVPSSPALAGGKTDVNYADMTLEQLMDIPVYAASKRDQKTSEAPSSVTLITAQEIQTYGWRTLGDLLRSTPGFYVSNPRTYGFLGVRGFGRPGDFGGRILMLVNGHRMNDPLYDTAAILEDFILDVDLIDRVEIVRGPGSALYGNNAFFAIVNIILKRGGGIGGFEAAGEAGTYGTYRGRMSYGTLTASGTEALVSASGFTSDGNPEVYYPEFDAVLRDGDGESARRFHTSLSRGGLTVEGFYVGRDKDAPPGYGTTLDLPRHTFDGRAFVKARYERNLTGTATAMARVYYDWYQYLGEYIYDLAEPGEPANLLVNRDESVAEGVGGEIQFNWRLHRQHSATLGADYHNNFRQMMKNFDEAPHVDYLDIDPSTLIFGFYIQDEYRPLASLVFTGGMRYDHYDTFGEAVNPRLACVYNHVGTTTLKLLFGKAFRAPNVNEFYYEDNGLTSKLNPGLNPENITTYEVVCEQRIRRNWRGSVAVFHNEVNDLIDMVQDPEDSLYCSANLDEVSANGAEFSVDGQIGERIRARASYTFTRTEDKDTGEPLNNAPEHLGKLNLTVPVVRDWLRVGAEAQYVSERTTVGGETLEGLWLANATLFSARLTEGLELSASAYNLFDSNYRDPTSGDLDAVEQDGRTFRLKVLNRF